jgi:uncharacterized membrane-anchored protein
MHQWHGTIAAVGIGALLCCLATAADAAPAQAQQTRLWDEVGRVALKGPVDVPLFDQAVLHLPKGEIFVPQPQADRLLDLFGNPGSNPDMPGLILPRDPKATWYMTVRFRATGYVKDDDARTWNADEMLASLKIGTDEQNRERAKAGIAQMDVIGWSEPPRYDAAMQRLVWALTSRVVDAKPDEPALVNYNTYALGREGYFTMNMVTTLADLAQLKPVAEQQLAALDYNAGKHYADFNAATDRVAAYGLASLVVGSTQPGAGSIPTADALTTAPGRRYFVNASQACAGRLGAAGSPVRRNGGRGARPRQAQARPRARRRLRRHGRDASRRLRPCRASCSCSSPA